jgi:hypothetical protein
MRRNRVILGLLLGMAWMAAGCGSTPKAVGPSAIRPTPQQPPTHQIVGDAIVASLAGVGVTLGWLGEEATEQYFRQRPGLVAPWPREIWKANPPTVFLLRIRNQTREEVQFDPGTAAATNQEGERDRLIPYEEFYMQLAEQPDAEARLRSLQSTLYSRFVVLPPGGQREGLLVFPTQEPKSKLLVLEIGSFFVGGRSTPGLFTFQLVFPAK